MESRWVQTYKAPYQVDNGLLRLAEAENVNKMLTEHLGIQLTVVDASQRFLDQLRGITDPEEKRRVIGRNFIEVFQETAKEIEEAAVNSPKAGEIEWLLQGTLYPDVRFPYRFDLFPHCPTENSYRSR